MKNIIILAALLLTQLATAQQSKQIYSRYPDAAIYPVSELVGQGETVDSIVCYIHTGDDINVKMFADVASIHPKFIIVKRIDATEPLKTVVFYHKELMIGE